MTEEISAAKRDAEAAASGTGPIERIAQVLGANAGARAVFGEAVDREGITVIPVAQVRWGFGGGQDSGKREKARGGGGGGGLSASPLGYIEVHGGQATFRRISDPSRMVPLVLAAGFAAWLVMRSVRKLIR